MNDTTNDTTSAAPSDAEIDAQWRESVAKAVPECTCAAKDMPFGRCCKWCGHDNDAHDRQYGCAEDGCDCETPNAARAQAKEGQGGK